MLLPVIRHTFSGLNLSARPRPRARKAAADAARARIPTDPRKLRREHGITPPVVEARAYAAALDAYFARVQGRLLSATLSAARARGDAADENPGALVHDFGVRVATRNAREFRRVFGIKPRDVSNKVDQFREKSLAKIRSLEAEQVQELRGILDEGLTAGVHPDALIPEIEERFSVTRSKARTLARDQAVKLNADITRDRQTAAGVDEYVWITSRDERVRGNPSGKYPGARNHWRLHGRTFKWSEPPVTDETTGHTAHPGEDPGPCRCVAVPVIPDEMSAEDEALFAAVTQEDESNE
jgi:SPP1 gp7 family putative phage head morphogenesis protein